MTRTLFRGTSEDKRRRFMKRRYAVEAGYAFFMGAGILFLVSVTFISAAALFRSKTESLSRMQSNFYDRNKAENERILADWGNLNAKED